MKNVNKNSVTRESDLVEFDQFFVGPNRPFVGPDTPRIIPFVWPSKPFVRYASSKGFTLIELLITLVIAAILLVVGVPNLRTFIQNSRVRTQVNDLVTDLTYARSEAVKRGLQVGMCPSNDGKTCLNTMNWQGGYLTFVDSNLDNVLDNGEPVVRYRQALSGGDTLTLSLNPAGTPSTAVVIFQGMGNPNIPGGYSDFEFSLSDPSRPGCGPRQIEVNTVGQVDTHYTSTTACP